MRDAELRFATLRHADRGADAGPRAARTSTTMDVVLRHPGDAQGHDQPHGPTAARRLRGLDLRRRARPDLLERPPARDAAPGPQPAARPGRPRTSPARRRVYEPITALPTETLPETFVHPAGYCQNVLATGRCAVVGHGPRRPAARRSSLECDHPRTTELAGDRPGLPASRSRSIARRASSSASSSRSAASITRRRRGRSSSQPDAPLPPYGVRLRLPDRDDDALLTAAAGTTGTPPADAPGSTSRSSARIRLRSPRGRARSRAAPRRVPWTLGPLNQFLAETKYQSAAPPRTTRNTTGV